MFAERERDKKRGRKQKYSTKEALSHVEDFKFETVNHAFANLYRYTVIA